MRLTKAMSAALLAAATLMSNAFADVAGDLRDHIVTLRNATTNLTVVEISSIVVPSDVSSANWLAAVDWSWVKPLKPGQSTQVTFRCSPTPGVYVVNNATISVVWADQAGDETTDMWAYDLDICGVSELVLDPDFYDWF